jgi:uncharacterized protein (TIGR00369 family)
MKGDPAERGAEAFRAKVNKTPYYRTIAMELVSFDKEGSLLKLRAGRKHHNPAGFIHGCALTSLLDSTCGFSVVPHLREGESIITISLNVDFISSPAEGEIIGRGRLIHRGKRVARAEAVLTDGQDRIIAKGYASIMISRVEGNETKTNAKEQPHGTANPPPRRGRVRTPG